MKMNWWKLNLGWKFRMAHHRTSMVIRIWNWDELGMCPKKRKKKHSRPDFLLWSDWKSRVQIFDLWQREERLVGSKYLWAENPDEFWGETKVSKWWWRQLGPHYCASKFAISSRWRWGLGWEMLTLEILQFHSDVRGNVQNVSSNLEIFIFIFFWVDLAGKLKLKLILNKVKDPPRNFLDRLFCLYFFGWSLWVLWVISKSVPTLEKDQVVPRKCLKPIIILQHGSRNQLIPKELLPFIP